MGQGSGTTSFTHLHAHAQAGRRRMKLWRGVGLVLAVLLLSQEPGDVCDAMSTSGGPIPLLLGAEWG